MEQSFDTSFIPQKPIFKIEGAARTRTPIPLVSVIGFAIFFVMLILTLVTFVYNRKYTDEVVAKQRTLDLESANFKPAAIEELKVSTARMRQATRLLKEHTVLSPVVALLETLTLKSVSYANFMYTKEPKGGYTLRLQSKAPSYGSVLNQVEVFRNDAHMLSVLATNISLEESSGAITFDLVLTVDPKLFSYENMLVEASAAMPVTVAPIPAVEGTASTTQTP